VARRLLLKSPTHDVGERLLTSKLQMLSGTGNRRPGVALSILTGRVADQLSQLDDFYASAALQEDVEPAPPEPVVVPIAPIRPQMLARTVYMTESHLRDVEAIIQAWQPGRSRRLTRSAVLRRAIEHLRTVVEADPDNSLLECQ
jgi:hypothetical protein